MIKVCEENKNKEANMSYNKQHKELDNSNTKVLEKNKEKNKINVLSCSLIFILFHF